jgi:NTP pyrophosphatase (non-canonical NTP hydrolase)
MSKKAKVLISALVAAILLTAGATAAVVAQEEPTPPPEARGQGFLSRVAEILDIPVEELVTAFRQARHEVRSDVFNAALERAVDAGAITAEEAGEIRQWLEQRPDTLDPVLRRLVHRIRNHLQAPRVQARIKRLVLGRTAEILGIPREELVTAIRQARQEVRADVFNAALERAVDAGAITAEEAGEIRQWLEQRPEALDRLRPHIPHAIPR